MLKTLTFLMLLLAASLGAAQPGPAWAESLEVSVANSRAIVVGRLVSLSPLDGIGFVHEGEIQVEETIKGQKLATVPLPLAIHHSVPETWMAQSRRLLVFISDHPTSVVLDKDVFAVTADLRVIRNPEALLREVRRLAKLGASPGETFRRWAPRAIAKSLPGRMQTGMGMQITVPLDRRLEAIARRSLLDKSYREALPRDQAVAVLSHFRTRENLELFKSLLDDQTVSLQTSAGNNMGHGRRVFSTRAAAYETLTNWGVQVPKPTFEEDYWAPDEVTYAFLSGNPVKDETLIELRPFRKLNALYAGNSGITDAQLALIGRLSHLRTLDISYAKITDEGMAALEGLAELESLSMFTTGIGARGLSHLAALQNLKSLDLNGPRIDDEAMAEVAKLRGLRHLVLAGTRVTPAGLRKLAPLKNLNDLTLSESRGFHVQTDASSSVDENLRALADAGLLHALTGARGKGTSRPNSDREVTEFWLYADAVGDDGIRTLSTLPNLTSLVVTASKVTDRGLEHLRVMPKLEFLTLGETAISDEGMKTVGSLRRLRFLNLDKTAVSDAGLASLMPLTELRQLILSGTRVTNEGLRQVARLSRLEKLYVPNTTDDTGLRYLLPLKRLESLWLFNCPGVTDAGLRTLARFPQLKEVVLWGTKTTHEGGFELRKLRPNLKIQD